MKIILKKDIDALGTAGEIIEVKRGYARNHLIPSGAAIEASPTNMKIYEEEAKLDDIRAQRGKKTAS